MPKPPRQREPSSGAQPAREVSLFRNGSNQAVRIPRDLELPGDRALLRRHGDQLILEPVPVPGLLQVLASMEALAETLLDIPDPPPDAVDL